jgi:hypothetical protein
MKEIMCTRQEVQEIIDRMEREMHREFKVVKEERDARIIEIAQREIRSEKDSLMKFIGFGGIIFIGSLFYYGGQITGDIAYMQQEMIKINNQLESVEKFMNAGDRYTTSDALELKAYVDQQDDYILRRVDDGFAGLSKQIDQINNK